MVNFLATRVPELAAGVAFYGSAPNLEDVPKIKAALLIQSRRGGRADQRELAGLRDGAEGGQRALRAPRLSRHAARLQQRHDAAVRRRGRQARVGANARALQQTSALADGYGLAGRLHLNRREFLETVAAAAVCRRSAARDARQRVGLARLRPALPSSSAAGQPTSRISTAPASTKANLLTRGARARTGEGASGGGAGPVHLVQQLRRDQARRRTGAHAGRQGWSTGLRRDEVSRRRRRSGAAPHVCARRRPARADPDSFPGSRSLRRTKAPGAPGLRRRSSRSSRPIRRRRSSGTPTRSGPTSARTITTKPPIRPARSSAAA